MIYLGNFKKLLFWYNFCSEVAFAFVLESLVLLYGDFSTNSHSVYGNEAMKRGNEALNTSML
jgi:hypothetical protein